MYYVNLNEVSGLEIPSGGSPQYKNRDREYTVAIISRGLPSIHFIGIGTAINSFRLARHLIPLFVPIA